MQRNFAFGASTPWVDDRRFERRRRVARGTGEYLKRPSQQPLANIRQPRNVQATRALDLPFVAAGRARSLIRPERAHYSADSDWIEAPVVVARTVMRFGELILGG